MSLVSLCAWGQFASFLAEIKLFGLGRTGLSQFTFSSSAETGTGSGSPAPALRCC